MANHLSALKRMRQSERRRARNRSMRTAVKTQIKKLLRAVDEGKIQDAQDALKVSTSLLQKSVGKGVYHRNAASRKISRLAGKVSAIGA